MNSKFRYFIIPSATYTLEWDDGVTKELTGKEMLDVIRHSLYLGEDDASF